MIVFFSMLLGLLVGSFLNVVIVRLPRILRREWQRECEMYLAKPVDTKPEPRFNLAIPRSHCPKCLTIIRAWDTIPLLSYLLLRGRCRHCKTPIGWRYPLVELLTALLTTLIVLHFGLSWAAVFALGFSWSLLVLFFIDIDTQLLPDNITIPLLWLGLLANQLNLFTDLSSAMLGALIGYVSFWLLTFIYGLVTKRVGMGHGDFKLLAAIGAWVGYPLLPQVILIASLLGSIVGIVMLQIKTLPRHTPIAFGPYLIIAGMIALVWGKTCLWLV